MNQSKEYYDLADAAAAESLSTEHLVRIITETRKERNELREKYGIKSPCRCGSCEPAAHDKRLCRFTRMPKG